MEPQQVFAQYSPIESDGLQRFKFCPACGTSYTAASSTSRLRCSNCGFVMRSRTSTGVAIIVTNGTRFVLCRRGPSSFGSGLWCLPQGGIEYGEDFLTAALREVKEETSLDVHIVSLLSVTSNFLRPGSHSLVAVLLAKPLAGYIKAGDDADDCKWFRWGEQLPALAFEGDHHLIERYLEAPFEGAPVDPRYAKSQD